MVIAIGILCTVNLLKCSFKLNVFELEICYDSQIYVSISLHAVRCVWFKTNHEQFVTTTEVGLHRWIKHCKQLGEISEGMDELRSNGGSRQEVKTSKTGYTSLDQQRTKKKKKYMRLSRMPTMKIKKIWRQPYKSLKKSAKCEPMK